MTPHHYIEDETSQTPLGPPWDPQTPRLAKTAFFKEAPSPSTKKKKRGGEGVSLLQTLINTNFIAVQPFTYTNLLCELLGNFCNTLTICWKLLLGF